MLNDGNGDGNGNGNGNGGFRLMPSDPDPEKKPSIHWENLGSARLWFGSLGFALLMLFVAIMLGVKSDGWQQAILIISFVVSMVGGLAKGRYWCPYCRSRVKPGATVCLHCGRDFDI